ncbi:MAG: NAD(P)-dependent glycerol-3-phosphate dehydrogenase, partial [Proteobacteria bacterium]|nr:NAD(P)-dependent glycerol-3-phosphate dehydrogenase [Pseudomonadota bacterium]
MPIKVPPIQKNAQKKVLVLGAGNFGTCLANHLAIEGHDVSLWARSLEVVESINKERKNPKYLSTITLAPTLRAINTLDAGIFNDLHALIVAVPMQAMRNVLTPIAQDLGRGTLLTCAVKGIEIASGNLPVQVYAEIFGEELAKNTIVLSGPSFAIEVAQQLPTAVVAASRNSTRTEAVQRLFHAPHFRVYSSEDPIGLEVASALKNVIAIAAGASAGLGLQMNSLAAIITRGLSEMTHLGVKMGANPITFQGLGGVGDLFLTCSSDKSRNYSLGYKLGTGLSVAEALDSLDSVAEGYTTAKAAHALSRKYGVETPIINQVYQVLYEQKPINVAVKELVTRDAR